MVKGKSDNSNGSGVAYFSKADRKLLMNHIKGTNAYNEDACFDLGKMLRDYGLMIMCNVIRDVDDD